MSKLPNPLNAEEKYLHAIALRADALCNMFSSFLEAYANKEGLATTNNVEVEKDAPQTTNPEPVVEVEVDTQCNGITKSGNRCKGTRVEGSEYCHVHAPKGSD